MKYRYDGTVWVEEVFRELAEAATAASGSFAKLTQELEPKSEFEADLLQLIKEQKEEHND